MDKLVYIPDSISPGITLDEPNEELILHEGSYQITSLTVANPITITLEGSIIFQWLPFIATRFSGTSSKVKSLNILAINESRVELSLSGIIIGVFWISGGSFGHTSGSMEGYSISQCIIGDKSVRVNKIKFAIPNLRSFHGEYVNFNTGDRAIKYKGRLTFSNQTHDITIDKMYDFDNREKLLRKTGGYLPLYWGELIPKSNSINLDESTGVFDCFDQFISFLNGRRVSAIFIQGICDEEVIWTNYNNANVALYQNVSSWPPDFSIEGLKEMWSIFQELYKREGDEHFLKAIINWYVEANEKTSLQSLPFPIENAIVMAQNALELLYNYWLIEYKRIIIGKETESMSAANKIRLILSQSKIKSDFVPSEFRGISKLITDNSDLKDAVDAIVYIRNSIVHSQLSKRQKLNTIDLETKMEALTFSVWIIEVSLLNILKHNGQYSNRVKIAKWKGEDLSSLPWNDSL